jgi:hypothetical protein
MFQWSQLQVAEFIQLQQILMERLTFQCLIKADLKISFTPLVATVSFNPVQIQILETYIFGPREIEI